MCILSIASELYHHTSLPHEQVCKLIHAKLGQAACIGNNTQYSQSHFVSRPVPTPKHKVLTSFAEPDHSGRRCVA